MSLRTAAIVAFGFLILALILVATAGCSSTPQPCTPEDVELNVSMAACHAQMHVECKDEACIDRVLDKCREKLTKHQQELCP